MPSFRSAKRAARSLLRAVPAKGAVVRAVAKAPAVLKPPIAYRILNRVIESSDLRGLDAVETNLGALDHCVCMPGWAHPAYLLGTVDALVGERGAVNLAVALTRHSGAFLDIGAHLGYFTFIVRAKAPATIPLHFVEPNPELFGCIARNVSRQRLANVFGHRCAIDARTGEATFYTNLSHAASSSLTRDFAHKHLLREDTVMVRSFDDLVSAEGLNDVCAKVDIEGAEFQFLSGATHARSKLRFLIIEVLGPAVQAGFIAAAQTQLGMNAYYINDLTLEPAIDGAFRSRRSQWNWLFCRESPAQLRRLLAGSPLSIAA